MLSMAKIICLLLWFIGLLAVGVTDWRTMKIPDRFQIFLGIIGFVGWRCFPEISIYERGFGMIAISLPFYLMTKVRPQAIGGGDIKLAAVCGIFLGWKRLLYAFVLASLISGIYGFYCLFVKKKKAGDRIPFGSFLCVGAMAASFPFWDNLFF